MNAFGLTNNQLKLIAMVCMLCDHVGKVLLPQWTMLQVLGRLAMPIFAYMVAEGCLHTRNKARYFLQLFSLAVGCQLVYFFAMQSLYQNILVTFSLAVAVIFSIQSFRQKPSLLPGAIMLAVCATVCAVAFWLPRHLLGFALDYGSLGVFLPVVISFAPTKPWKLLAATLLLAGLGYVYGGIQWFGLLAIPLLALYNGQRGKWKLKYLFYIFYPSHLAVIYLLSLLLG